MLYLFYHIETKKLLATSSPHDDDQVRNYLKYWLALMWLIIFSEHIILSNTTFIEQLESYVKIMYNLEHLLCYLCQSQFPSQHTCRQSHYTNYEILCKFFMITYCHCNSHLPFLFGLYIGARIMIKLKILNFIMSFCLAWLDKLWEICSYNLYRSSIFTRHGDLARTGCCTLQGHAVQSIAGIK